MIHKKHIKVNELTDSILERIESEFNNIKDTKNSLLYFRQNKDYVNLYIRFELENGEKDTVNLDYSENRKEFSDVKRLFDNFRVTDW